MTTRAFPMVTWAVGSRTCTLRARAHTHEAGVLEVEIEWAPNLPGRLTPGELEQYIAGRDRALSWFGVSPEEASRAH